MVNYMHILLSLAVISGMIYNIDSILRFILLLFWYSFPFFYIYMKKKSSISNDQYMYVLILFLFYMVMLFSRLIFIDSLSIGFTGAVVEMLTPLLFSSGIIYLYLIKEYSDSDKIYRFFVYVCLIIIIMMLFDFIFRYLNNPYCSIHYSCRSAAKRGGVFINSNIVGQLAGGLILVFLIARKSILATALVVFFLIFSFSRAAWLAVSIAIILFFYIKSTGLTKVIFSTTALLIIVSAIIIDPLGLSHDGSGLSKFEFFQITFDIIKHADALNIIFGFGASYSDITTLIDLNGWSPHASVLKAFLYYGLVGVIFYLYIIFIHLKMYPESLPLIVYYVVIGLSGAPIYWPSLTMLILILFVFTSKNSRANKFGALERDTTNSRVQF